MFLGVAGRHFDPQPEEVGEYEESWDDLGSSKPFPKASG